jgi:sigma-B regulation protein RsbU (phosphoserine phosphatase)
MFGNPEKPDLMQHLMDNIKDNIYFMDRNGRIILINKEGAKWLGFDSPEEVIGKTDLDIFTNEHGVAAYKDEQHIMETGVPILGKEEKETWADGRETWVSTSKMPLRNEHGEIRGVFGISRDITEHKQAEIRAAQYAEENRKFRDQFEDDLHMAAELQKTFLPTSYPVFADGTAEGRQIIQFHHYHHSGGLVGGDFCSIRKLSETEAGLFLCDVMGHGVQAALGTAIIRAMVEEISHQEKDPAWFLAHMNRVLTPILRQGDQFLYATACYMIIDVATGILRYSGAGHSVPIRIRRESADWLIDQTSQTGPALAITADAVYETFECTVQPGDNVFMFTDGIHEVEGAGREEYGEARLLESAHRNRNLSLDELLPALFKDACSYAETGQVSDDVCLVGLKLHRYLQI